MASPLQGRVKRLETTANIGGARYYAFIAELLNDEEWLEIYGGADAPDVIYELKPLARTGYIRRYTKQVRRGSLDAALADRQASPGKPSPQVWVCSTGQEAATLMEELQRADAFSRALIFTDLEDELQLGTGGHRVDQ